MMEKKPPSVQVKQVDAQVNSILRKTDWDEVNEKGRKAVTALRQDLSDARVYASDYELSEMRDEQLDNAKKARKYLDQARTQILRASEFDVFGAVDVAHLTAQIEQLKANMK
jgi:ribosome-binding factor A